MVVLASEPERFRVVERTAVDNHFILQNLPHVR